MVRVSLTFLSVLQAFLLRFLVRLKIKRAAFLFGAGYMTGQLIRRFRDWFKGEYVLQISQSESFLLRSYGCWEGAREFFFFSDDIDL